MIWLRKGIVHLLGAVLLLVLLGLAATTGLNSNFAHPDKLENWLVQSKLYDHIIPAALDKAQTSSQPVGSESISFNDASVRQAATAAFSPAFLQNSVNTFLNGNYAWLEGKTAIPQFTINLTAPKKAFASQVGQLAQAHLANLPTCTPSQLANLRTPIDPFAANCRPASLDPKTESTQVTQEVNTGNFINKPVITATTLQSNRTGDSNNQPYYQKFSRIPKLYRLGLKLPWILAVLALLLVTSVFVIAPTRRKGVRRIGVILLEAGVILIAFWLLADYLTRRFQDRVLTKTFSDQLHQPYHDLLHQIESSLVRTDLYFGIIYLLLAIVILAYIFASRGKGTTKSVAEKPEVPNNNPDAKELVDTDKLSLNLRRQRLTSDNATQNPALGPSAGSSKPRPPRLIQ